MQLISQLLCLVLIIKLDGLIRCSFLKDLIDYRRDLSMHLKVMMQSRFSCLYHPAKGGMNEPLSVL